MYWAAQGPTMPTPLQLICTDFDGTLHSDFTEPPVPQALQTKLAQLQAQGATWVIKGLDWSNCGLSGLSVLAI